MNNLNGFFPLSAKATNGKGFVISVLCYLAISIATGFIFSLLTGIPAIGVAINFISQLIDLYCWGGIVVSIMKLAKVL